MPEGTETQGASGTGAAAAEQTQDQISASASAQEEGTLLGTAGEEGKPAGEGVAKKEPTPEEKVAAEKKAVEDKRVADENKKLLDSDDKTLTPEQLAKKQELVKANEKAAEDAKGNAVPDKYTAKLPEGVQLNTELVDAMTPVLKEHKITQAAFQKLVEAYTPIIMKQTQDALQAAADNSMKVFNQIKSDWKADSDKLLGAEPAKELAFAGKFLNQFGSKELRKALNDTGMGNHPELLKAMIAAGRALSEDGMPKGPSNKPGGDSGGLDPAKFYSHPTSPK